MAQRKVNCEVYTDRGIAGKDGAEGKSAYQQAVEGGYQGTEEEFEQALASDISVVANNVTNINVVGNNIENVNTAVDNMAAIIAAPTAATQAEASASQAATSETNAQTSETNAATSASNASASATNASASATIATTKASEATSSATSASASATSASTSATSASISSANAEIWAEGTDAQVTTLGGEHSSKGWANVSKQYAESIGSALKYKGSVSTYSALPSTGQEIGDTWNVLDTGDNYAWTGTEWDKLSGTVDLSAYRTSADQDIIDATKQDTISDLSTIREGAALGATSVQPEDLATVATSGMYSDLTGTPGVATADTLGLVKPDGTTITVTEDGTISATGGGGSGSGFDFEGTKAEFDAAVAAGTITADSVSLITDDVSGDNVATKAELQAVDRSKADTALSNVLANIDYVVESKCPTADDQTWYRKYKSGWLEQGGLVTVSGTVGATVTLLKPFANTAYNIQLTLQTTNAVGYLAATAQSISIANSKTTTSFGVQTAGIKNYEINGISWCAEGQGVN